jgi:hypothetical protein
VHFPDQYCIRAGTAVRRWVERVGTLPCPVGDRRLALAIVALLAMTVTACARPVSTSADRSPASSTVTAATPSPTPLPTSVSAVVTARQVAVVRAEAARQGAVVTFARADPSGIVVVRPPVGHGSTISARSLAEVVKAQGGPALEVKVASTGTRRQRLSDTFERYAASHTRPGVYVTFAYRKDHHVFTLATNAPVDSLRSLLKEHGDELVVTYASPGCQVCGG